MLMLTACGQRFEAAYPGEIDCGRSDVVHAIERATCDGSMTVACSCDDRHTLECVGGSWSYAHFGCSPGLGVTTEAP